MRDRLTAQAHRWHAARLAAGDLALDATLGNGHDALFLARQVGRRGHLYGFDRQSDALTATRSRLAAAGVDAPVSLFLAGHEVMTELLPDGVSGRLAAAMFNLGYLPGGDKSLVTEARTTVSALRQAWRLLRPGGRLSILAYPGHPGGQEELVAVRTWIDGLGHPPAECREASGGHPQSPRLFLLNH